MDKGSHRKGGVKGIEEGILSVQRTGGRKDIRRLSAGAGIKGVRRKERRPGSKGGGGVL